MSGAKIAIIGAGMAGLSCASELAKHGIKAILFDKGRGPGGRMAARRAEVDGKTLSFDHGAQFFTARDPAFIAATRDWIEAGAAAEWTAAGEGKLVGTPGMNGPLKHMAASLDVRWGVRVTELERSGDGWRLQAGGETLEFFNVLVAIPAEQVAQLLDETAQDYAAMAAASTSDPCWAVMAAFTQPLPIEADTLRDPDAAISWAARDGAKPGRAGFESWVLHASSKKSRAILEFEAPAAAEALLAEFFTQSGIDPVEPIHLVAHRWRYAQAEPRAPEDRGETAIWDSKRQIGMAGDWLANPRVEGAWLSGNALAKLVAADQ